MRGQGLFKGPVLADDIYNKIAKTCTCFALSGQKWFHHPDRPGDLFKISHAYLDIVRRLFRRLALYCVIAFYSSFSFFLTIEIGDCFGDLEGKICI
ncbi:hypothetical protein GKIL_0443 [Gloeobacter kilaueensis JS1]|uniref:Uncharacterized protein n=1 Tax=Gloeobacter kilaueensis (strain ATCC BAA-2537 / CCAP 1431/1 / ULC 316 / JS1) TaxID=1183438 RepID=U5QGC4_GLOK1|nr:hypothetical protein GKIL_0443 [Gloeobacter kilaueensis JS1]